MDGIAPLFSSPLWGLFFNRRNELGRLNQRTFSSPLSGIFFNLFVLLPICLLMWYSFRPLSWGLFFNAEAKVDKRKIAGFRPLSRGLFFNSKNLMGAWEILKVFVPSLGDFFSIVSWGTLRELSVLVFVPFLGDFFSMPRLIADKDGVAYCFRPLSRGLFFNK